MFFSWFSVQVRMIRKQKLYFLMNVFGLALGLASAVMIMLWIADELSYEKGHEKADRIRLLYKQYRMGEKVQVNNSLPLALAPTLRDEVPGIVSAVRFTWHDAVVGIGEERYMERTIAAVDPDYFKVFTFEFLYGDPADAFPGPRSVVLTEGKALKYFGTADAAGKSLRLDNGDPFTVTGIIADIKGNTYLDADMLVPFGTLYKPGTEEENWYDHFLSTYILLEEGYDTDSLNSRLTAHIRKYMTGDKTVSMIALPIRDRHLHNPAEGRSRAVYIYIFSVIGWMIILIACINFTNVSTSISLRRTREIAIRKISGADRSRLIRQFMGETLQQSLPAFVLAMMLVELLLPQFNLLSGKTLEIPYDNAGFILSLAGLLVITTVLAGIYPSVMISAFSPIQALYGRSTTRKGQSTFRTALVIFQFAISIGLIISTLTIYSQLRYMYLKDLGYDKENLLYIQLGEGTSRHYDRFHDELLAHIGITGVARSSSMPSSVYSIVRGLTWEGKPEDITSSFAFMSGDEDLVETLGLQMIGGRNFSRDFPADTLRVLVNEEAARVMGYEDPVGQAIYSDSTKIEILGMFRDFNGLPLTSPIEPMLILMWPEFYFYALVRIAPGNVRESVATIEKTWNAVYPGIPFEYGFVDASIEDQYRSETRLGKLSGLFTILAILITAIGLFAVSGNSAQARFKEIGVRKAMGASAQSVIFRFMLLYLKWVLVASLISLPVMWLLMDHWLDNFAYRTGVNFWIFLLSLAVASVIALLSITWHAYAVSRVNPVNALKYE